MDRLKVIQEKHNELTQIINSEMDLSAGRIMQLADQITEIFLQGGTLAFVGNGGSAAEAIHLAAEFTGHCVLDHKPLNAICLNESQSALTAIANDYGYEFTFSRLVEAHLKSEDVLIVLSTSGTSKNVVNAMQSALKKGVRTLLWTGLNAPLYEGVEIWRAPSSSTPRIQELHLFWGHLLAELIESNFQE